MSSSDVTLCNEGNVLRVGFMCRRGGSRGGVQGVRRQLQHSDNIFLGYLYITSFLMVHPPLEKSAPSPKKNPGSAPVSYIEKAARKTENVNASEGFPKESRMIEQIAISISVSSWVIIQTNSPKIERNINFQSRYKIYE